MQNTKRKVGIQDNYKQMEQIIKATPDDLKDLRGDITVTVAGLKSKGFEQAGVTKEGFKVTCGEVIVFTGADIDGKYEVGAMACSSDHLMAAAAKFLLQKLQQNSPAKFMSILIELSGFPFGKSPSMAKEQQEESEAQTADEPALH